MPNNNGTKKPARGRPRKSQDPKPQTLEQMLEQDEKLYTNIGMGDLPELPEAEVIDEPVDIDNLVIADLTEQEARRIRQHMLRAMVSGAYDLQRLRIETGNRVVQYAKELLGQRPGMKETELDAKAQMLLKRLRQDYKKITVGVVSSKTKMLQVDDDTASGKLPSPAKFQAQGLISSYTYLCLIDQYFDLVAKERTHFNRLEKILAEFPIYTEFLKDIRGIGPAMAAVLVAYVDFERCQYASSLWKYVGLDTLTRFIMVNDFRTDSEREAAELQRIEDPEQAIYDNLPLFLYKRHFDDRSNLYSKGPPRVHGELTFGIYRKADNKLLALYQKDEGWEAAGEGRSRRSEHLIERPYINKNGEYAIKKSITFNDFLKTKIAGVLAVSFLRMKNERYRAFYDQHKAEQTAKRDAGDESIKSDRHIHNRASRFMVKQFLLDLYYAGRYLSGLPVYRSYEAEKLKFMPKTYEEYELARLD